MGSWAGGRVLSGLVAWNPPPHAADSSLLWVPLGPHSAGRLRALAPLVGALLRISRICRWVAEGAREGGVSPSRAACRLGAGERTWDPGDSQLSLRHREAPSPSLTGRLGRLVTQRPHSETRRSAQGEQSHGREAQPVP